MIEASSNLMAAALVFKCFPLLLFPEKNLEVARFFFRLPKKTVKGEKEALQNWMVARQIKMLPTNY